MKIVASMMSGFLLFSCSSLPPSIQAVDDFELDRYLGTWYEIARLDHRFERGLQQVTATYTLNPNRTVRVENSGFKEGAWKNAVGKARFSGGSDIGLLEVSFFGPFYGPYVIFELDQEDYLYAFVTSGQNYLWLLSRTPTISEELKQAFLSRAQAAGYDTEALIFVEQN